MSLLTNLNAYWTFEGNANDSSGNSNNGTATDITYSSGNGKVDQGAGFNGSTSKIVLTNSATLKPTGNFSIAAWFKKNGNPSNTAVILNNFAWTGGPFSGYQFSVTSGGKVALQSFRNTGTTLGSDYQAIAGSTTVTDNAWHLLVGVYNGSTLKVYVDNVEDGSVNWTHAPGYAATTYPRIGVYVESGSDNYFTAMTLDEIGLWGKALSADERTQLWSSGQGTTYPFPVAATGGYIFIQA